jgi:hypothetical protein
MSLLTRRSWLGAAGLMTAAAKSRGFDVARVERARVLRLARGYLAEKPVTVTAAGSPRSAGGVHDFFSEGDYWWPDPKNPDGPYVQRDGMTNPANFVAHRQAMVRLSLIVPALAAAYKLTGETKYARAAWRHLAAWFVEPETRMNPNLEFAQAIHGRTTGRGTGIIDTLHLVEVARAAGRLGLAQAELEPVKRWFSDYIQWMSTSRNGLEERDTVNNHATCWVAQVAGFAELTGERRHTEWCLERYKKVLVPGQMAVDGSFPKELARTKPYGYSIFQVEVMAILVATLSAVEPGLWRWETADGRGMGRAMAWLFPYLADKRKWPKAPDVMYFDEWPVRQVSLVLAGLGLGREEYLELWRKLNPDPATPEVLRNFPVRQPVLWV